MKIDRVYHFVLTVASIDATCEFYSKALGMLECYVPKRRDKKAAKKFL